MPMPSTAQAESWNAVTHVFGVRGGKEAFADIPIAKLELDDIEIQKRCEQLEEILGISLALPLMDKTFGQLAEQCERRLERATRRPPAIGFRQEC